MAFKPTKQQVLGYLYNLNEFSNSFPPMWTEQIQGEERLYPNLLDLFCREFISRWNNTKNYFNLLLLESKLPCRQQQFSTSNAIYAETFEAFKKKVASGEFEESDSPELGTVKFSLEQNAQTIVETFIVSHEEFDKINLVFRDGVAVRFRDKAYERSLTECSALMNEVNTALDDPKNKGKSAMRVKLNVWERVAEEYRKARSKALSVADKGAQERTLAAQRLQHEATLPKLVAEQERRAQDPTRQKPTEQAESSGQGGIFDQMYGNPPEPTGQGRTRRRRRKGNKTKARKVKGKRRR
jgi:hypothetical protein